MPVARTGTIRAAATPFPPPTSSTLLSGCRPRPPTAYRIRSGTAGRAPAPRRPPRPGPLPGIRRSRPACSPGAPRARASCRSCRGRPPRRRRAAPTGGWRNSTPLADELLVGLLAVVDIEAEAVHAALVLRALHGLDELRRVRRPGDGEADVELGLARVDDGAPAVAVAEGDVVLLLEAQDVGVELLRLVDVLDEDTDDGDVGDHGTQARAAGPRPASPRLRSRSRGRPARRGPT